MLFTTKWISAYFNKYDGAVSKGVNIDCVMTDSRKNMNNALFIPIVGEHFDGHDYVDAAINNGAIAVVWEERRKKPSHLPKGVPVFYVEDTLIAMHELAMAYRDYINPTVIGITGSNGKTTTKDIVSSVLGTTYRTHYTSGNFNNHIGLPLTILSMPTDTEMLVLEMGMNHKGEIEVLSKIAKPDYAIITNIGESHIEYLGSREGIAAAKLEICKGLKKRGQLILDGDEPLLHHVRNGTNVTTCGFDADNNVCLQDVQIHSNHTTFQLADNVVYSIPLLGRHHAKNATYAIALGSFLNIDYVKVQQGLKDLAYTGMRFEMIQDTSGAMIINDAYNASPTSMKAAIEVVKSLTGFKKKVLVLGDIFELGKDSLELHRSVANVIDSSITTLFTVGDDSEVIMDTVKVTNKQMICKHFTKNEKNECIKELRTYLEEDVLILFKASRGMKLESLIESLH